MEPNNWFRIGTPDAVMPSKGPGARVSAHGFGTPPGSTLAKYERKGKKKEKKINILRTKKPGLAPGFEPSTFEILPNNGQ